MKPHMSTATTAGTAYGRKITMRKKPEACRRALSIASAATSASPSMIGTWMSRNSTTRPKPSQNCGSTNSAR